MLILIVNDVVFTFLDYSEGLCSRIFGHDKPQERMGFMVNKLAFEV